MVIVTDPKGPPTVSFKASWKDDGKEFSCQTNDVGRCGIQCIRLTVKCELMN